MGLLSDLFSGEKKDNLKSIARQGCYSCGSFGNPLKDTELAVCPDCGIAFCWVHGGKKNFIPKLYCPKCGKGGYFMSPY
jgi:predicted RNA-binding Zn-ribbon protein involved in translation (DUF1610 family)